MEKGFNDDELADIMNEIESLEKEFSADMQEKAESQDQIENIESHTGPTIEAKATTESVKETSDFEEEFKAKKEVEEHCAEDHDEDHHVEAHHVLGELSKMDVEKTTPTFKSEEPVHNHTEESNVRHLEEIKTKHKETDHQESAHTTMSFHVEGDMKFDLSFHIGGQFVGLTVTEEGLEIGLEGGAKFTVPVHEASSIKKAS